MSEFNASTPKQQFCAGKAAAEGRIASLCLRFGRDKAFEAIWEKNPHIPTGYLLQGVVEIGNDDFFKAGEKAAELDFLLKTSLYHGHVKTLKNLTT